MLKHDPFNPRFQGIHFVRFGGETGFNGAKGDLSIPVFRGFILLVANSASSPAVIVSLSIPVFRGFILLGKQVADLAFFSLINFQSPFSGDSFC